MDPIDAITACNDIDTLKDLWSKNVKKWKKRKDFSEITKQKDRIKFQLSWVEDAKRDMLRYNDLYHEFCSEGVTMERIDQILDETCEIEDRLKRMFHGATSDPEKYSVKSDGLEALQTIYDWMTEGDSVVFKMMGKKIDNYNQAQEAENG